MTFVPNKYVRCCVSDTTSIPPCTDRNTIQECVRLCLMALIYCCSSALLYRTTFYCNVELCIELSLLLDMCIMCSCLYEILVTSKRRLRPMRSGHLSLNVLNMAQLAHSHCTSLFSFCLRPLLLPIPRLASFLCTIRRLILSCAID